MLLDLRDLFEDHLEEILIMLDSHEVGQPELHNTHLMIWQRCRPSDIAQTAMRQLSVALLKLISHKKTWN